VSIEDDNTTRFCLEITPGSGTWFGFGTLEQARNHVAWLAEKGRVSGPIHHAINLPNGFWGVGSKIKGEK
jgi:hypothetical protein